MERKRPDIGWENAGRWDWNLESNRVHYSARWVALVGCEAHEVGNTPDAWLTRVHPEDRRRVTETIEQMKRGPSEFDLPHRLLHTDGSYHWMACRGVVQRDAAGQAVRAMGSHADVTAETVTDRLTGLPNCLLLHGHLMRSIERANRYPGFHFAVLLVDLDSGTPVSSDLDNALLVSAARRLETCLRVGDLTPTLRHDDLVVRMQGEQFAILLDGVKDVADAAIVAERVLGVLLEPFTSRAGDVLVSASIGIAVSATGYADSHEVLRDAETALHRAKRLGKSRSEFFDTGMLESIRAELQLEADFVGALDRREFRVFYQPVVSIVSNSIVGFEALTRWQHPVLGLVSPLDFIPVAEKTGFIVPLGMWVLREACAQLKAWQEARQLAPDDLWVSVNVSGVQLLHPQLLAETTHALKETGLDARCLVVELTEAIAADKPAAVRAVLMELRALGISISVDDFGTGHSSLARLREYPIDYLKVDRSFVRGIETSHDMSEMLGAVSAMARQLGLKLVVEGVENQAQLGIVRSRQCDYVQGYLFSQPLTHVNATALLESGLPLQPAEPVRPALSDATVREVEHPRARHGRRPSRTGMSYAAACLALGVALAFAAGGTRGPSSADSPTASPFDLRVASAAPGTAAVATGDIQPPTASVGAPAAATGGRAASDPSMPRESLPGPIPQASRQTRSSTAHRVLHQHRLGGCRGVLTVSRQGVAFVPDDPQEGDDAFRLLYGQFVHRLADDGLTITSSTRTYRFKPSTTGGASESGTLPSLAASMARLR